MTTEPKPLDLPPEPEWCGDEGAWAYALEVLAHARQLAEIAQAQAALADGLAEALEVQKRLHCECEDVTGGVCVNCEEIDAAIAKYRENRHV